MNLRRFLFICLALVLLAADLFVPCYAALPDIDGYSVYQNGSTNLGHVALLNKDGFIITNNGVRIVNALGFGVNYSSNTVMEVHSSTHPIANYGDYNGFWAGFPFLGYYRPKNLDAQGNSQLLATAAKNNVKNTGSTIINIIHNEGKRIKYTLTNQIQHSKTSGTVTVRDITGLRCDGFTEYCYEANGIRICGNDSNWNISIAGNKSWHNNSFNTNPKKQAYFNMINMLGDLNADGKIDAVDARLALRISTGSDTANFFQEVVGAADGNGTIDAGDARWILRYSVGLETYFPGDPIITYPLSYS